MKLQRTVIAPLLVMVVTAVSGGWLLQRGDVGEPDAADRAQLFREVLEHISTRYVDGPSSAELYDMAIEGLIRELGDPHTSLMTPEQYANLRVQTEGEYGGLGTEIGVRNGWVTIIAPLPDTPAERAGLQAGDRIIEVDGESTEGWTQDDAVTRLRGPKGEPVDLKIRRSGVDEPIAVTVVRDEIHFAAVQAQHMMEGDVGYVQLRMFSEGATREIQAAVENLRGQGATKLILDLRLNPGGLLEQGVSVSDLFLPRGNAIVETRAREARQNHTFRATRPDRYEGMPVVVLVNEYSASASEIVAGALQDHDRAVVMGTPTFGKGSVQTLYPLSAGNFLKVTTGRWYTPVGRSIERERELHGDPVALLEGEPDPDVGMEDDADRRPVPAGEAVDTTERRPYRTDSGRTVYGGGGIVPDVIVRDVYSEAEQELIRAIHRAEHLPNDLFYRYVGDYIQRTPDLQRDFEVTPRMRAEFLELLRAEGVQLPDADEGEYARFIDNRIGFEIALRQFGRPVAMERHTAGEAEVRAALELLRQATDPASLIALAQERSTTAQR